MIAETGCLNATSAPYSPFLSESWQSLSRADLSTRLRQSLPQHQAGVLVMESTAPSRP